jgi:carboxyl-terminal processing protease
MRAFRFVLATLAGLAATSMVGCAVIDPHNIINRNRAPVALNDRPVAESGSQEWRKEALEFVWNTVNEKYYDPKFNGVDWKAARAKHEPLILAAKTDDEYWELLDKMTGELKDSHTRVHSPKQVKQQRDNEAPGLGIGFMELGGALVLTSVHPESDAYWAGARAGMSIKSINGEPALPHYKRLVGESRDTSTPWARTRGAQRKISAGDVDTIVNMTFVRSDGSEIAVTQKRRTFRTPPEFTERMLPSGFGYVRFSGFIGSYQSRVLTAIDKMKESPGLIVDLRGNGGGSGNMARVLISKFLTDTQKVGRVLTRTGQPVSVFFIDIVKTEPEFKGDQKTAYTRPLVILTNEFSASASEVFASTLQDLGRATVIGRRTCGCLLGYLGYADVPGGGALAYSELGYVTPKGKRVEGEGVLPDIDVPLAQNDLVYGRDRTLEAAVKFLQEKVTAGKLANAGGGKSETTK